MDIQISVIEGVLTAVVVAMLTGMWAMLAKFIKEQKATNEANRKANRAMQKSMLLQAFHRVVELGEPLTDDEFQVAKDCYEAYHANGGNGTGTVMWESVEKCVEITTGIRSGT